MLRDITSFRRIASLFALAVLAATAVACGAREDPFIQNRGLPTPTSPPVVGAVNTPGANQLLAESVAVVRLAQWNDKRVQFENALAGYIMVWGYDYRVDIVNGEPNDYQAGLAGNVVDVVMEADEKWVSENGAAAKDLGPFSSVQNGTRIAMVSGMETRYADRATFLSKVSPSEDKIVEISGTISAGRIGIKPEVAAMVYLKNNEAEWTPWVPAEIAGKVKQAMADGKTSLVNRICIPSGANGVGTGSVSSLCN
ncbi:MAG: hypothetical protein FJ319_06830 [SAR202 cluster bacterium]|nr:hypothetical protein [SAR202 cluster bacterium]